MRRNSKNQTNRKRRDNYRLLARNFAIFFLVFFSHKICVFPREHFTMTLYTKSKKINDKFLKVSYHLKVMKKLKFLSNILKIIYPKICISCQSDIQDDKKLICSRCLDQIKPSAKIHKPLPHLYSNISTMFEYDGCIKDIILNWKYKYYVGLENILKKIIISHLKQNPSIPKVDLLIPVPLHTLKYFKREFNQSEKIAKWISSEFRIPVISNNLVRTKNTKPMKLLDTNQRRNNISHAFKVLNPEIFKNKSCLLVDDIFTTGATINECSRAVKKCKPLDIKVLTVAG